ncbi:MAG TPA: hypothetical protein VHF89_12165, partial [Solirubrobacteraceae bacterium]|nr:hypothetical protein [Solirubrobacteraceae bacterium]
MRPVKDILTAVTAALLALGLAAVAIAQAPGTDVRPDTEFTPTPRDEGLDGRWKQRGGAVWRADASSQTPPAMAEGSTAPMTVDFYGVSFLDESNGLAVGAACAADTAYDDLDTCERRPAIYTYTELPGEPAQWLPAELDGAEAPGYVADVAWIGPGRALAVGGTGRYPYREPATPIADDEDPAGNGRVWLLEDGAWTELARPEGLGALTAIAMSERPGDCGATTECGAVGGLRQLWTWRDGELHREEVTDAFRFRFRVRDIVFAPGAEPPALGLPKAYAVTSGCCSGDPTADLPSLLVLGEGQWYGRSPWAGGGNAPLTSAGARTLVDSLYSVMLSQRDEGGGVAAGTWTLSYVSAPGRTRGAAPADAPAIAPDEPASRIIGRIPSTAPEETGPQSNQTVTVVFDAANGPVIVDDTGTVTSEATNPLLADVRLVSGGGDLGRTVPQGVRRESPLPGEGPDGVMDWAVGEQVSTGRALAMTTLESGETVPNPFDCPGDDKRLLGTTPDCRPAADPAGKARSRRFLALPSYRLNSFAAVGVAGEAWAVGDKGAIMQLGGDGGGSLQLEEPNPPKLPRTSATTPPDTSAWDPFRPVSLTTEPGVVPPLATRPREPLIEPALEPAGTADPSRRHGTEDGVSAFAMSPDGREGWAVGPRYGTSTEAATLHHYDGERWYPCDPVGIGDQVAADEACAGLSELLSESGANAAEIETIVRVPYENDDEPGNDDRFEAVAVGRAGATSFVLRYDGARWGTMPLAPDNGANTYTDVEFTSPTDGWLAAESVGEPSLYRWDGTAWTDCRTDAAACGFAPGQLPLDSTTARPLHLARAGDRLYLGGNRKTASSGGNNDVPTFPFILYRDGEDGWTAEDGGYDPFAGGEAADQGWLQALSVAPEGDGYRGWAIGRFGGDPDRLPLRPASDAQQRLTGAASAAALHLDGEDWTPWTEDDALADHFRGNETASTVVLTLPDSDGEAFAIRRGGRALGPAPPVRFSPDARRWEVVATPFDASTGSVASGHAVPQALGAAPDGSVWLVALGGGDTSVGRRGRSAEISAFYRFDDERTKPVFEDVAHPIREDITDVAATKDGGVWVSTAGNAVYRYDRVTGWDRMTVPGWASSGAARAARANAIAVGPDGRGLVVGQAGRIAEVGPLGLQLDAAAGTACAAGAPPPCGTARDLHAVAIAPDDGSAIAAGDGRVVLWRKPGEGFRALPPPPGLPFGARFTSASMPSSSEVYLTADTGHVVAVAQAGDRDVPEPVPGV